MCTNYVYAIYNALQNNVNHHFSLIHRAYGRFYVVIQNLTYGKRLFLLPFFAYTQSLWQTLCRDSEFNLWETAVLLPFFAYTQSLWQILCRDSEFNLWETAVFTTIFCLYTEPMADFMS